MVTDLNFPVDIVAVPTVREGDGLAMSSRNRYLSETERDSARELSRALFTGREAAPRGPAAAARAARVVMDHAATLHPPVVLDYCALIDPTDFTEAAPDHTGPAVLAVAAKVGATRLIDNIPLEFGAAQ
jgi:pantoate--beta-alanine ligase